MNFDPAREAVEFRNQLSSDKRRLAFFFGAGISQAVGIPGLVPLTKLIQADLGEYSAHYERLLVRDKNGTLETVLNRVRLCREMLANDQGGEVEGLSSSSAAALDRAICRAIRARVGIEPPKGLKPHYILAHWLKNISRTFPLEIFTTNYDQLLEVAMESAETPFFDGFIGSVSPFFRVATIDADFGGLPIPSVPKDWVRLWKLHGSIGWVVVKDQFTGAERIVRRGGLQGAEEDELMIFPSRQKYSDSRRLPFIVYQDRLRRLLASGETLLVTSGYSFADQHLNEIIFQSLRSNPRLAVTVLSYDPLSQETIAENLVGPTEGITNLTIYGPDAAVIGGNRGSWTVPSKLKDDDPKWPFWDYDKGEFRLGDFTGFVDFLRTFLGARGMRLPSLEPSPNAQ